MDIRNRRPSEERNDKNNSNRVQDRKSNSEKG